MLFSSVHILNARGNRDNYKEAEMREGFAFLLVYLAPFYSFCAENSQIAFCNSQQFMCFACNSKFVTASQAILQRQFIPYQGLQGRNVGSHR